MPNKSQTTTFSNFTQWIKGAILRKPKPDTPIDDKPIKRSNSTRRTPSKRPFTSNKRRRSRKINRRSGSGSGSKSYSNSNNSNNSNNSKSKSNSNSKSNFNSNSNSNSDSDSDSDLYENNKNENFIIINDDDFDSCSDNNNKDNKNNDNNMIIPNVNSDTCELSTSNCKDQQRSRSSSFDDNDYLENTRIIKGSVEHFAYIRTLRKLRKDRQRPMNQAVLLNNILEKISIPSLLSDEIRKELTHFKSRVYELNRLKRNSIFNINDTNGRSLFNNSISSLCPTSLMNKRLSAIIAEVQPVSPITMKYRPSYASSKVVTVFDEISNQLIVKDLPVARRKRRLSDLSNILVRSGSSSSTTSTNSSQSSLVTLTDDAEQLKYSTLTKEPESYIPNHIIIRKDDDDDEEGCYEDDVPLFVIKEQFKYSGRGYGLVKNNLSSLEGNGPPCVTLTV